MKKTKIVCTMGPACRNSAVLEEMLRSGMNIALFNMSHGDHEYHRDMIQAFLAVRDKLHMSAAVLMDTKGPEIRVKEFKGGKEIKVEPNSWLYLPKNLVYDIKRDVFATCIHIDFETANEINYPPFSNLYSNASKLKDLFFICTA